MTVRLEQLLAAATPGPWRRYILRERVVIDHAKFRVAEINADPEGPRVHQDAALIALAPDMARLLIDMGEWARAGRRCPEHGIPDCSPLLNGCSLPNQRVALLARLDALGEKSKA